MSFSLKCAKLNSVHFSEGKESQTLMEYFNSKFFGEIIEYKRISLLVIALNAIYSQQIPPKSTIYLFQVRRHSLPEAALRL